MANSNSSVKWKKVRNWIIGLTSILVVIPALINAGRDIYIVVLNMPRTQNEQINSELFKKYFNKTPLAGVPVQIKSNMGTFDMKLSIYEAGDIFVEYGKYSQWFPFPLNREGLHSVISYAYAQLPSYPDTTGQYIQVDKHAGGMIERERWYSTGTKETYTIDQNTGEISNKNVTSGEPPPSDISGNPNVNVFQLPTIDIEALKSEGINK